MGDKPGHEFRGNQYSNGGGMKVTHTGEVIQKGPQSTLHGVEVDDPGPSVNRAFDPDLKAGQKFYLTSQELKFWKKQAPDLDHLAKENKIPADIRQLEDRAMGKHADAVRAEHKAWERDVKSGRLGKEAKDTYERGGKSAPLGQASRAVARREAVARGEKAPTVGLARIKPMTGPEKALLAKSQAASGRKADDEAMFGKSRLTERESRDLRSLRGRGRAEVTRADKKRRG
jgi:hypothetical protein